MANTSDYTYFLAFFEGFIHLYFRHYTDTIVFRKTQERPMYLINVAGILVIFLIWLRRGAPVVHLVSAGAPEPWFSENARASRKIEALENRLWPIANAITIALLVIGLMLALMGYYLAANILWGVTAILFVAADMFPMLHIRLPPRPLG